MKSIPDDAEEHNGVLPAKLNDITAPAESAYNSESISVRSGDKTTKIHSFSRTLAKEIQQKKQATVKKGAKSAHGAHEALVLKYLAFRVRTSKKIIGGKKRFYATILTLTLVFPYLGYTTISEIVHRLQALGYVELGNFNQRKGDLTFWYHVPDAAGDAAEADLIYFDSAICDRLTVPQAVLLRNFEFWVEKCQERGLPARVGMSPTRLSDHLPFSIDTIKRGLKVLEKCFLKKVSTTDPIYEPRVRNSGANPNERGANPNGHGANPNGIGANPNDVTSYVTISNPLETSSKEQKPAAFDFCNSSGVTNDEHQGIRPSHGCTPPIPGEQQREALSSTPFSMSHRSSEPNQPASSTCDIVGAAENVTGGCACPISSFAELRYSNRDLNEQVTAWPSDVKDTLAERVIKIACSFLGQQSEGNICQWNDIEDPEELFAAIAPSFTEYFHRTIKSLDTATSLYLLVFGGTLESIIGAFLWPKMRTGYTHQNSVLERQVYRIQLAIFQVVEATHRRETEAEFAERRSAYASKDAHKEDADDLAPEEKTRVFRNALHARNKVGWIFYDGSHRTHQILVSKRGLARIERLFELNTALTPTDLLRVMDVCMEAYRKQPAPPNCFHKGIRWHTRHGRKLDLFASYLSTIVKQLGMVSPVNSYLNDTLAELVPDEAEPEMVLAA